MPTFPQFGRGRCADRIVGALNSIESKYVQQLTNTVLHMLITDKNINYKITCSNTLLLLS